MSYEYNPRSLGKCNHFLKYQAKKEDSHPVPEDSSDSEDELEHPTLALEHRYTPISDKINRETNIWRNLPNIQARDVPAHFVNQLEMTQKIQEPKQDGNKSLSRMMDEVSPPNVVINKQFFTEQNQHSNLASSREGSSSPEVEKHLQNSDKSVPPNITITSRTLPESIQNCFPQQNHAPPMSFSGEIHVPKSFQASNFHLEVLDGNYSNTPKTKRSDVNWMDTGDSLSSAIQNTPVSDLLKNPDIINNQTNSLTKALYAMKGFAQDFRDLRIKSLYTEDDVSRALRLVYGEEYTSQLILDFEKLLLPLHSFLRFRPVMEKWITSVRPNDVVAQCPDWDLPIEIARDRRRKRSSSDSDDRERRRQRKRTKIDQESKRLLEAYYQADHKPSGSNLLALARRIHLDRDVVRVWFANRRQKAKRQPLTPEYNASFPGYDRTRQTNYIETNRQAAVHNSTTFEDQRKSYDSYNDDFQDTFMSQINNQDRESVDNKTSVIVTNTGSPLADIVPASPEGSMLMTPETAKENDVEPGKSGDEWDPLLLSLI